MILMIGVVLSSDKFVPISRKVDAVKRFNHNYFILFFDLND